LDQPHAAHGGVGVANAENDSTLLAEAGELGRQGRYTPRIERTYPLEQIAEAHAYAERGHTRGKIVVRV
jgi:NADPH:quinone reductase-like Zn-dependent oxidoreductase